MSKTICLLPGDGIGTEIVAQGRKALEAAAKRSGKELVFTEALIGGAAYDATGNPLPADASAPITDQEALPDETGADMAQAAY